MTKNSISFQLIPRHNHRDNLVEHAILICKAHFKTDLSTVHPYSLLLNGIDYSPKHLSHSAYYLLQMQTLNYQHILTSLETMISTKLQWSLLDPRYLMLKIGQCKTCFLKHSLKHPINIILHYYYYSLINYILSNLVLFLSSSSDVLARHLR